MLLIHIQRENHLEWHPALCSGSSFDLSLILNFPLEKIWDHYGKVENLPCVRLLSIKESSYCSSYLCSLGNFEKAFKNYWNGRGENNLKTLGQINKLG